MEQGLREGRETFTNKIENNSPIKMGSPNAESLFTVAAIVWVNREGPSHGNI